MNAADDAPRRAFFESLPKFAQGYLEAAFSTGIYHYYESGDVIKITGLGPHDTPADLLAGMAGDAIWFQAKNTVALAAVCEEQGYNMMQAGRDLWFTRNHCEAGYQYRGIVPGSWALESLIATAHGMGKFSLFAEPLHASPDPLDASDWGVESDVWPDVATAEQWAAVNPASKSAPNKET